MAEGLWGDTDDVSRQAKFELALSLRVGQFSVGVNIVVHEVVRLAKRRHDDGSTGLTDACLPSWRHPESVVGQVALGA